MDLCKFLTLTGSVHFVDMNLDPSRGSSTVWINVKVYPYRVRPFCGLIMFLTLVRSVYFVDLCERFTLIGSVHFVDLCRRFTFIGSERHHFVAKEPLTGDKRVSFLIVLLHFDLIISREGVHEA